MNASVAWSVGASPSNVDGPSVTAHAYVYGAPAEVTVEVMATGVSVVATTLSSPSAISTCRPSSPHTTCTVASAVAVRPVPSVTSSWKVSSSDVWSGSRSGVVNDRVGCDAVPSSMVAVAPAVCVHV